MDDANQVKEEPLVHPLISGGKSGLPKFLPLVGALILILAGIGTGFLLAQRTTGVSSLGGKPKIVKTQKMAGSTDTKAFPDKAEGVIEKGGIEGEGTHKLVRDPKNPSQTVYLTSTVINLDEYVGKKARVWGQTFAAHKAGWLMDVGRVEILE